MLGNVFNVYCCFTKLKTTYNELRGKLVSLHSLFGKYPHPQQKYNT
jgi:hypothetical protein